MLNGLIIASFICWILGFIFNGFTFYNVMILVPTIMFAVRKFGIHVKLGSLIGTECLFLFFSIAWKLIFSSFTWKALLLCLLFRFIAICLAIYDDTTYVYVQEERKKHDK